MGPTHSRRGTEFDMIFKLHTLEEVVDYLQDLSRTVHGKHLFTSNG